VQPLGQLLQLDCTPRKPHGQLALQEGGDLDQRALAFGEAGGVRAGRREQQPEARVERRFERDGCLSIAGEPAQLLVEGLALRPRCGGG